MGGANSDARDSKEARRSNTRYLAGVRLYARCRLRRLRGSAGFGFNCNRLRWANLMKHELYAERSEVNAASGDQMKHGLYAERRRARSSHSAWTEATACSGDWLLSMMWSARSTFSDCGGCASMRLTASSRERLLRRINRSICCSRVQSTTQTSSQS